MTHPRASYSCSMLWLLLLTCALVQPALARGEEMKTTPDGIAIEAKSLGDFTLSYPVFLTSAQEPAHKIVETKADGKTATVRYEGGALVEVAFAGAGKVTLTFAHVPTDVKYFQMNMLIDIAFSKGGHWTMGDASGAFPREKPAQPHLHQANATAFQLTNAQGQSLALRVPEYSFQQLTDNRQWNWPIFHWLFNAPFDPARPQVTITVVAVKQTGSEQAAKLVDRFGQSTREEWPGKLKSLDELRADVESDKQYYASLQPPRRAKFGGLLGSGARLGLHKTGFFHVEQHAGKWWLVDPDGNAFFHLGICGFNPGDDYTHIKGREQIYEWLPPLESEFKTAFRPDDDDADFSFHVANMIRKYGKPYDHDDYVARMIERVRKWGFNSMGAFSALPATAHQAAHFPYVANLPLDEWQGIPRLPGVFESFDPFEEKTRERVEDNIAKAVPAHANDPLLIGWFIVNEPRFDEIPRAVPALDDQHACKRRLVRMLGEKYQTIEAFDTAWKLHAKSFDELNRAGLPVTTRAVVEDMQEFTGLFLDAYFSLVSSAYRRHDPNHLLLGCRLQPITIDNEQLCRIAGTYLDVMSFNYYTYGVDTELMRRVHRWTGNRPLMLSEFFWSSPLDSGLVGGREVHSQQERGLAYRYYVEQSAALGFVIGIEWFTLVDQAVTGRWFSKYNGESANTGLIAVTDRPWKTMLAEMMKTNNDIYAVLLGERSPFTWNDPRFKQEGAGK